MSQSSCLPRDITLDPTIINHSLLTSLLRFWIPSYPEPTSNFNRSDVLRWFSRNDTTDEQCRAIAGSALSMIGPSRMPLPEFKDYEADRENYNAFYAPFAPLLCTHKTEKISESLPPSHAALALIILLDQMPRNNFRDEAQAVVCTHYDRLARAVASEIRAKGLDREPSLVNLPVWLYWLYLPLEHSESLRDHNDFRKLLDEMLERARDRQDQFGERFLHQAKSVEERHYTSLERFGRFPWRNRWLGRESTADEEKWLREGGDTFGTG